VNDSTDRVREFLSANPTFLFFLVLALWYLLGSLGPRGKELGRGGGRGVHRALLWALRIRGTARDTRRPLDVGRGRHDNLSCPNP